MNINEKISLYRSYIEAIPVCNISVRQFYENIVFSDYVNEIEAIRTEPVKKKRDKIKATLPAVTISGTFSHRSSQHLTKHSGFICIDIDAGDNPSVKDWGNLRNNLGRMAEVLMAGLSVSGLGVFLIIPLAYPQKHLQQYLALEKDFATLGIAIDKNCKDVSRLRGISSDTQATWNDKAQPYRKLIEEPKPTRNRAPKYIPHGDDDLNKIIDLISRSHTDITADYKHWFEVGAALANEKGEAGRNDFHAISQYYSGYSVNDTDRQFSKCLKNPKKYGKATIFYLAKNAGITIY